MTHNDIQEKFLLVKSELVKDITNFVNDNAKFKVGDLINIGYDNHTYVVDRIGYSSRGIEYFGKRVKKNGELANITMFSGVGVSEDSVSKATLSVNKKTIESLDLSTFNNTLEITIKLSL